MRPSQRSSFKKGFFMKLRSFPMAAAALAMSLSLAGCGSSEPTESEMFDAMLASDHQQQMSGSAEKTKEKIKMQEKVKKIACEKSGEKTYKCTVGQRSGQGMALPLSFTKGDDGWVVLTGN
jgi:outer membrane lipoprotein SlyB